MISAWASQAGITLGQLKVDEKSNEIPAIPALLDLLDIEGTVINIDAMVPRRRSRKRLLSEALSMFLRSKALQGTLNEDVELYFQYALENDFTTAEFDYHKTVDKDHG